jgi:rubrerythrin
MGEYADMILDGEMCEWCGNIMDDDDDYPHLCPECLRERDNPRDDDA